MKYTKIIFTLLIFSMIFASCDTLSAASDQTSVPPNPEQTYPIDLASGYGLGGSWYEVYFTDPESNYADQLSDGPDIHLVDAIDNARMSVDVAAYSITLNSVRYALIRAHQRGVPVRIVMESSNMDGSDVQALIEAGIHIVGDKRDGLMHDKFIVIDRSEVWTGSMNFTNSGTYEDNNNMLRIRSVKIAENYETEFNEMFEEDLFGEDVRAQTPNPQVTVNSIEVKNYFSPDDHVLTQLYAVLSGAEESIYFLAFSFTSNELGKIVREKAEAGLTVKGVMDREQVLSNTGTEYDPFRQAGLDVRIDGNEGQMHHKIFIIDDKIVITGSYNFSNSAETRNDENVLIIYDESIADFFMQEFWRVYAKAEE